MASGARSKRVGDLVRAEISDLMLRGMKDPRIGLASVTEVRMSPDLRHARVYISVLGDDPKVRSALAGLRSASGYLQRELGARLRLRNTPKLTFIHDETIERAAHMEELFRKLHDETAQQTDSNECEDVE